MKLRDLYLTEGYGRTYKFSYRAHSRVKDPWHGDVHPEVLVLGRWRHNKTKNELVGGINLNYLSQREKDVLQRYLHHILNGGNTLRDRVRFARGKPGGFRGALAKAPSRDTDMLRRIFDRAYRTYRGPLHGAVASTLRFKRTSLRADDEAAARRALADLEIDAEVSRNPGGGVTVTPREPVTDFEQQFRVAYRRARG
jgi:hypothetical protein